MRAAIITGASSGIGLATTRMFLENGCAVLGIGRDADKLSRLKVDCGNPGERLQTLSLDVMEDDAPERAVSTALDRFGRLDHLVNNAGIGSPAPVHETDDETLDYFLGLMLRAPFRMCRAALKAFGDEATVVNISSTYSILGGLRGGAYSAAKAGLDGLTRHMACQYGTSGVRTNSVAPGVIPTPMTHHRLDAEGFRRMNYDMTPAARMGTAEDVAQAIWFLSSPASGWINGQTLAVDGGWTTTKFLTEEVLDAERTLSPTNWTHSGKPPKRKDTE